MHDACMTHRWPLGLVFFNFQSCPVGRRPISLVSCPYDTVLTSAQNAYEWANIQYAFIIF